MDTLTVTPGTVCILDAGIPGAAPFEIEAQSNIVNSRVQFKFADSFEWVHVSRIIGTR